MLFSFCSSIVQLPPRIDFILYPLSEHVGIDQVGVSRVSFGLFLQKHRRLNELSVIDIFISCEDGLGRSKIEAKFGVFGCAGDASRLLILQ